MEHKNKEWLITGGTGSLGKMLVKHIKRNCSPKGIRIYSRSELNQFNFRTEMQELGLSDGISFIIGDVVDGNRLSWAMRGVDYVINCAAMKRIEVCEENPYEALQINATGVQNVIFGAIVNNVKKVLQISTDKAVQPITFYGATKMTAEGLIRNANVYSGDKGTKFSCVRYGNVFGSNGSVVKTFQEIAKKGKDGIIPLTSPEMTRFWITLPEVVNFIVETIKIMQGGEIFIPEMPVVSIETIAKVIAPEASIKIVGTRGTEKMHEILLTKEESHYTNTYYCDDLPYLHIIKMNDSAYFKGRSNEWEMVSNKSTNVLSESTIKEMLKGV